MIFQKTVLENIEIISVSRVEDVLKHTLIRDKTQGKNKDGIRSLNESKE